MGTFLIFILLCAIVAGVAWWHVGENRELTKQWQASLDPLTSEKMIRFAWTRTAQLLLALVCCVIVILVYEWRLSAASRELVALNKPVSHPQPQKPQLPQFATPQRQNRPIPQRPAATISRSPATSTSGYYPPLVAQPKPAQQPQPAAPPKATINDVYSEQNSSGNEAVLNDIKKRYESAIVTYMFLKQCGKTSNNDYTIIMSALAQEMTSAHAPPQLQNEILTSAQGSYKEMYSRSSCNGPDVDNISTQYMNYIQKLSNNGAR